MLGIAPTTNNTIQLGVTLKNGIQLRYPATNLTSACFLNDTNQTLASGKINVTYQCGGFAFSLGFDLGSISCYVPSSIVNPLILADISIGSQDQYLFFVSPSDLSYIIALSSNNFTYETSTCSSIFLDDTRLVNLCQGIQMGAQTELNFTLQGYNSYVLGSVSAVSINTSVVGYDVQDQNGFIAGALIYRNVALQQWDDLINSIVNTIIIQISILILFIIVTIALTWKLSAIITNKIINPIELIKKMLKDSVNQEDVQKKYNKEVNEVVNSLTLLNILKNFIDPHFLLNPDLEVRIKNLEEAYKLFEALNSNRGKAIVENLIGNAYYLEERYDMAETYYALSLNHTIALQEEVIAQESKEKLLSSKERSELKQRTRKVLWSSEKSYLQESIVERKQQLCMALEAQIDFEKKSKDRGLLKRINELQLEILEYYVNTRTHYIRMIRVLINMAKIFQCLQFYHSGLQLLDIVKDELTKIQTDGISTVDIDITRLKSIGIDLKLLESSQKTRYFSLNGIGIEKGILLQHAYYRKGMILVESGRPQEAGHALTDAIVGAI